MVRDHILTRAVDRVAVKGRREGTVIFEVMCLRKSSTPEMRELSTLSDQILNHYTEGEWDKAIAFIQQAITKFPNDKVLGIIMHRCMHYKNCPPEGHWDGITRMDRK
jgi:adenylate cyclase